MGTKAAQQKTPEKTPNTKKVETVQAATLTPDELGKQRGYANQLDTMGAAGPPQLTVDQFMEQFKSITGQLAQALPQTKGQHDSDDADTKLAAAGAAAKQGAEGQVKATSSPLQTEAAKLPTAYAEATKQEAKPQELEVDPVGHAPEVKQTAPAAPKPRPSEEVSLDDKSRELDDALTNHEVQGQRIDVDEAALALPVSGEPSFDEAGEAKRKAQDEIEKATPRYRGAEQGVIGATREEIQSRVDAGLEEHHAARGRSFDAVLGKQNEHKTNLEGKKRTVFLEIEGIYTRTRKKVDEELAKLQTLDQVFDGLLKEEQAYFDKWVRNDLEYIYTPGMLDYSDWKDEHEPEIQAEYENQKRSGEGGGFGIDPRYLKALRIVQDRSAEKLFANAKLVFVGSVNRQVEQKIAKPVVDALNAAKQHIHTAKEDVTKAFATLGPKEQEEAQHVLKAVTTRFEQLEESVDDRQREIVGDLARTYNQSVGKLRATFDAIKKDVLTSWWEKAWNKIKAVVNAIIEFATRIVELLGRLAHLVGDIISSPRAFFRNLVSGIGQGFSKFVKGIDQFLATAFFDWLRGASGVAVRMPSDLGPRGIFGLFTQLLGLGTEIIWERMEVVYDKTVANAFRRGEVVLDRGLEIFRLVRDEGLGGLWDEIKNSLGGLLDDALATIKETVLYAAIRKVIIEIGKLLVPGGGFIAIAEKIIRLLQFIVEARDKILDLIEAFVGSVEMAVKGNVAGIVNHITGALTKFITLALDFLVTLFGLGGLKDKVTRVIERIRKPVIGGIDWVLNKFKPLVMKGKKLVEKGKEKAIGAGKAVVQVGLPKDPHERLALAARAAVAAARRLSGTVTEPLLTAVLAGIRVRYGLTSIEPYVKGGTWWVRATINPTQDTNTGVASTPQAAAAPAQASFTLDLVAAGVSGPARTALGRNTLSVDELVALHRGAREVSTGWIRVAPAVQRGGAHLPEPHGEEHRLRLASEYGISDYVRYHIRAPGLGKEGFPIPLAPVWMNLGANDIEGFMRRHLRAGVTVRFNVTRATFGGEELRPFFDSLLRQANPAHVGRVALDRGKVERFLRSITYEIELYARTGGGAETGRWMATMETGIPPGGAQVRRVLPTRI